MLASRFWSFCRIGAHEPTLWVQSCLLLDSEASAELGQTEISDDAESFVSPQAVTDDCKTHRDCLIDGQCKPPSSDRPDTLAWHCNPPSLSTHSDTDHNLLFIKKIFLPCAHMHPFPRFSRGRELPNVWCIWWIMYELWPSKLILLLLCCCLTTFWQLKG